MNGIVERRNKKHLVCVFFLLGYNSNHSQMAYKDIMIRHILLYSMLTHGKGIPDPIENRLKHSDPVPVWKIAQKVIGLEGYLLFKLQ
jgi:hypothetical protein